MLFESSINLNLKDADVVYYPNFFNINEADIYFKNLLEFINWKQDEITVFGKTYQQPRLTAFYADNKNSYKYSNIVMQPHPFEADLLEIKNTIETELKIKFTSCLANLYRDGNDSNGWHADNEKELGKNPIIASVSFGAERVFHFKHKNNKSLKKKLILHHGSLLLMQGETQTNWLHQIPKTKKNVGNRINLTFRIIA
ncbi:MAG: alpha-ketoglutarate-dependent dioxygenase AlkB [Algibacter sp.]|uniref:alpha-ketoglutarate-dependent dioxygenase AlkB family protein n=1 Tax=Algibacter sp. TaxID=1872428 RepID=UPI00262E2E76|nr:alpha-ketoglutarate-dependent dioxygenase AlkB [Algibacter sp.]MDG1730117.1 alpha-ketoglutarate-dependent dioxygenase AlkB [Algibacter sp.]MDG2179177.1 alpha-ketoglutarate-dependent dioxygenase AlkB [Algibacter sp.]